MDEEIQYEASDDNTFNAGFTLDLTIYNALTKDQKFNFNIVLLDIVLANMKELNLDEA